MPRSARVRAYVVLAVAVILLCVAVAVLVTPVDTLNALRHPVACGRAIWPVMPTVPQVISDPVTGAPECGNAILDRQMAALILGAPGVGLGLAWFIVRTDRRAERQRHAERHGDEVTDV